VGEGNEFPSTPSFFFQCCRALVATRDTALNGSATFKDALFSYEASRRDTLVSPVIRRCPSNGQQNRKKKGAWGNSFPQP
ncbi:hypothetical protein, partial [Teichococcus deserti]|uniref:hypothetical protein n=1 Tax=Teichococcus deserti TaxID=1817963 RepID=UPI001A96D1F1